MITTRTAAQKTILLLCVLALFSFDRENSKTNWWEKVVFYEIYMPSYADSDGNGYGDFKGIISKLNYLSRLGVRGIWLTPFLRSPRVDNGYDIADYYRVDPLYGSNEDFKLLLKEAHRHNIKVVMDMVLNHTSTESYWFQQAIKSKNNPYRDYYIWRSRPNNWESFFGGPAWKKDSKSGQYYYHKFDERMADLNWSNPKVVAEAQKILKFWLNMGIDGFRLDVIDFLTTNPDAPDNPEVAGKQLHRYDIDQPGIFAAIKTIKKTVNSYPDKFLIGEIGSDKLALLKKYQSPDILDVVFNFNFGSIPKFSAKKIFIELQNMEAEMHGYPTLFFGSHDMPRFSGRLADHDPARERALAALMLTARGVPFIYYGEEIGMENIIAKTPDEIVDIQGKTHYFLAKKNGKPDADALAEANENNRDRSRSPMQWSAAANAGFSSGKPWLPVAPEYMAHNVEADRKRKNSLLNFYRKILKIRNSEPALQFGIYQNLQLRDSVISFTRAYEKESVSVKINFGKPRAFAVPHNASILFGQKQVPANGVLLYKITK